LGYETALVMWLWLHNVNGVWKIIYT
jgi:hypothetical protein